MKKQKIKLLFGAILIILGVVLGIIFYFPKENEVETKEITEKYTALVEINPITKISYTRKYKLCITSEKSEICGEEKVVVDGVELVNDDAKRIYNEIDFSNKDFKDALVILYEKAIENEIKVENINITSDWVDFYSANELIDAIKNKSENTSEFNITVKVDEYINSVETKYSVSFDSDNGSPVNDQIIKENEKINKPSDPEKAGYTFLYWTLNEKEFDFETKITSDMTLKAVWKKNEIETNKSITKEFNIKNVSLENAKEGLTANIVESKDFKVKVTGPENIVNNLKSEDIKLFVDLKGLTEGTHSLKVTIKNKDKSLTYKIEDNNIKVTLTSNKVRLYLYNITTEEDYKAFEKEHGVKFEFRILEGQCSAYIEGGDGQEVVKGKTYVVYVSSIDPYILGGCGDGTPEDWECLDDGQILCAINLTKRPELLACAKQMKALYDEHEAIWIKKTVPPFYNEIDFSKYNLIKETDYYEELYDGSYEKQWLCKTKEDVDLELNLMLLFSKN